MVAELSAISSNKNESTSFPLIETGTVRPPENLKWTSGTLLKNRQGKVRFYIYGHIHHKVIDFNLTEYEKG